MNRKSRSGQSLLELVAATTIISTALVPALRLTRESMQQVESLQLSEMRVVLCTSKLEESLAQTAGNWSLSGSQGDYSAIGYRELRFVVTKSDAIADGGAPGRLVVISVVVWHDQDGGADLDAGEPQIRLSTKLAKIVSYEYEATLH